MFSPKDNRYYQGSSSPIFHEDGSISKLTIYRDITTIKQTEEALKKSERRLKIKNLIANIFLTVPDEEMYGVVLDIVLDLLESKYGVFGYIDDEGALVCPSMTRNIWDRCQMIDKDIIFLEDTWKDSIWGKG
ncbi:MAG: hypothetical protein SRB2_00093 [Desulfobacteraceae bacterium Eth-SRB2]|nr:MAG: hypothetical protein SRB2_00093 [Desulfobacteraceae bacterium Eth-SRB2]